MWIMLTKKLPTEVSPPKLSLFYSYSHTITEEEKIRCLKSYFSGWEMNINVLQMIEGEESRKKAIKKLKEMNSIPDGLFGSAPNDFNAVWINYKHKSIKVFPHEYSVMNKENLKEYMTESHELVVDDYTEELVRNRFTEKGNRKIFEAALLDGCDEFEAMMVAIGKDPSEVPPPIGWWKCKEAYARIFCHGSEMVG